VYGSAERFVGRGKDPRGCTRRERSDGCGGAVGSGTASCMARVGWREEVEGIPWFDPPPGRTRVFSHRYGNLRKGQTVLTRTCPLLDLRGRVLGRGGTHGDSNSLPQQDPPLVTSLGAPLLRFIVLANSARLYYTLIIFSILVKPFLKVITKPTWYNSMLFTVAETIVAVAIAFLYKRKPRNDGTLVTYFGIVFAVPARRLPREESVNLIIVRAFTRAGPPDVRAVPRVTRVDPEPPDPQPVEPEVDTNPPKVAPAIPAPVPAVLPPIKPKGPGAEFPHSDSSITTRTLHPLGDGMLSASTGRGDNTKRQITNRRVGSANITAVLTSLSQH
jgi:hypothetical protein